MNLQLQDLTRRIREMEGASVSARTPIPIAMPALERVLPDRSLPGGALVEFLSSSDGAGAWTLALLLGRQVCGSRKTLIIADGQRRFYPPALCRLGVDLRRTVFLRTERRDSLVAALVQALQCPAIGAVIGQFELLDAAAYRQLQLAAETGGGVGFLLLPAAALHQPSFAAVRLLVAPLRSGPEGRRLQVEVVRMRGGRSGQAVQLEIDHETGDVRLPAAVVDPASASASA